MATEYKIIHSDDIQDVKFCNRVLAGPGAGKTYWIAGQIQQILSTNRLSATQKVACITYTNKAATNIESRISNGSRNLEVSTIHAFLYAHLIKPYFHLIADEEDFNISKLNGHDDEIIMGFDTLNNIVTPRKKFYASKYKDYSSIKKYIGKFHWTLKDNDLVLESSPNNTPPMLNEKNPIVSIGKDDVLLYKKYVWKEYGVMHHDDVLYFSYKLINRYRSILEFIVAQYPYILIDEYQDSNVIQHYIFQQLATKGAILTIIGDKAQSIYRFAGSNIKYITSFTALNIQNFTIEDNRRSVQPITDFLNIIRQDLTQKSLVTGNYGIPQLLVGDATENFLKAKECCDGEMLVSLSWSNNTANSLKLSLSIEDKNNLLDALVNISNARSRFVYNCILAIENAKSMLMKDAINHINKAFSLDKKCLADKQKSFSIIMTLLSRESEYRHSSLLDLYNIVNSLGNIHYPKITKGNDADLFSNSYLDFAKGIHNNDEECSHLTIHKAKGLEYKNVILIFTKKEDAIDFLLHTDLEKKDDDHRLYYVACSRAKHRLFISIPEISNAEIANIEKKYGDKLSIDNN